MERVNPEKEGIIRIVSQLFERSNLNIEQVLARMQAYGVDLTRSSFENRFTTRVQQKPNIPPDCLLALIGAFTERLTYQERCKANEALELANLSRLPIDDFRRIQPFFPDNEFAAAFEKYVAPLFPLNKDSSKDFPLESTLTTPAELPSGVNEDSRRGSVPQYGAFTTEDWGEAPDVNAIYGRDAETIRLERWIVHERYRLVGILGIGGIGKTTLARKIAEQLRPDFDYLIWRSLQNAPPPDEMIREIIRFIIGEEGTQLDADIRAQMRQLIHLLRNHRCLLIFDGVEAIMSEGHMAGSYHEKYEIYQEIFHQIGALSHQSCLLLTSREKPDKLTHLEDASSPVRSIELSGLMMSDARRVLEGKQLCGSDQAWEKLVSTYSGNPMALKLAADPIFDVYGGDIDAYFEGNPTIFTGVRELIDAQFSRLSLLERSILYWLAIEREAVIPATLLADLLGTVSELQLLEALSALRRRSLVEQNAAGLTLQDVVKEYMTERFVELISDEVSAEMPVLLVSFALIKAQTKEYIRKNQVHRILQPILQSLRRRSSAKEIENKLLIMLDNLRENHLVQSLLEYEYPKPNYAAGNILNLLILLGVDICGRDLSKLVIQQADLRGINLQDVNLAHADCTNSVFTETFGSITSVAVSPDGLYAAAGFANGDARIWQVNDRKQLATCTGHTEFLWATAFGPAGKLLATGSEDHTIRLWEVNSGDCIAILSGHNDWVKDVAFSHHGELLGSCSNDGTIRLWDTETGDCLSRIEAHDSWVWALTFNASDRILASAGHDGLIKLWDIATDKCIQTLEGHTGPIRSIEFSPDGSKLVSGSFDKTVRIWDLRLASSAKEHENQQENRHRNSPAKQASMAGTMPHIVLRGHTNLVWSVRFDPTGCTCVSSSDDQSIRLWDASTGELLRTFFGHKNRVWSIAFSPDGTTLISGSDDQTLRFWDLLTGQSLYTLEGYSNQIWSIDYSPANNLLGSGGDNGIIYLWSAAVRRVYQSGDQQQANQPRSLTAHTDRVRAITFSHDGKWLVSGGDDQTMRLWNVQAGRCIHTLYGHTNRVWTVAISRDNRILASGSEDQTIRLWWRQSGRCFKIIQGNHQRIWSVDFSPDGKHLVSASDDNVLHLWEIRTGNCVQEFKGHNGRVWAVAFSSDGSRLISAGDDRTLYLWDVESGARLQEFIGHEDMARSVAFNADGSLLASGSDDQTVRVWRTSTGECLHSCRGHEGSVRTVAFGTDGTLFSGGDDEVIIQWDLESGDSVVTLRSDRPYERMNITDLTGLTDTQRTTLRVLGAVEYPDD